MIAGLLIVIFRSIRKKRIVIAISRFCAWYLSSICLTSKTKLDMLQLTSSISSNFLPCCPCIIILKLKHVWNMRCILDVQPPPDCTLLNHREVINKHGVDNPVPDSTKDKAHYCSRENLLNLSNGNSFQFSRCNIVIFFIK